MSAIYTAIDAVRRGGTVSLIGVYGGHEPTRCRCCTMFDKQLQFRMGQANVKRWVEDIMPLLTRRRGSAGHRGVSRPTRLPLEEAPGGVRARSRRRTDGTVKVVFKPGS